MPGQVLKVILETGYLTKEQIVRGCILAKMAGADFVKTSTGFGPGGATAEDVALMRKVVGADCGVKASGGIRDAETAVAMIKAGANRLGQLEWPLWRFEETILNRTDPICFCLLFILICGFNGLVSGNEHPADWFEHQYGSSTVAAELIENGETTLLVSGLLTFAYPDGFQLKYVTRDAPVTITAHADFLEVQRGSEYEYGYDRFWLFEDVKNQIFALAEFSRLPLSFSGRETIAEESRAITAG